MTIPLVPTISVGAIEKLLQTMPGLGLDLATVCGEAQFDRAVLSQPEARVPLVELYRLWEAVLARLARPDAALVVAQHYSPGDYGLLGFVCMNCATLGETLHHVCRYLALWSTEPVARLAGGAVEFVSGSAVGDRPGRRLAMEAAAAELVHGARVLFDSALAPQEVWFSHPAPATRDLHERYFKARVAFGKPTTLVRFSSEQLALPLPRADAKLGAFLAGLAEQGLAHGQVDTLTEQIRKLLAELLPRGVPGFGTVARRLATSERTLRRRLEEEGTTFRALLDQSRAELARRYLRNPGLALSEVAFLLGFSEPSAFHRAFRRWCGQTPAQYRLGDAGEGSERRTRRPTQSARPG